MGRGFVAFRERPLHFIQFTHEVCFCVQPSGRVTDQKLDVAAVRRAVGVVTNRGWIAVVRALDDLAANPLRPDIKLLDGRRPERVCRSEHDTMPFSFEKVRELRN